MPANEPENSSAPEPRDSAESRPGHLDDPTASPFFADQPSGPAEPSDEPVPPPRPAPEQLPLGIELPEPEELELEEAALPLVPHVRPAAAAPAAPTSPTPETGPTPEGAPVTGSGPTPELAPTTEGEPMPELAPSTESTPGTKVVFAGPGAPGAVVIVPAKQSDAVVIVGPTVAPERAGRVAEPVSPAQPDLEAAPTLEPELAYAAEILSAPQPEPQLEPAEVPQPAPEPDSAADLEPEVEPDVTDLSQARPPEPGLPPSPPVAEQPSASEPAEEPATPEPAEEPQPQPLPAPASPAPAPAAMLLPAAPGQSASAAATGDLRPGGVSGIRLRPQRVRLPRRPLVPRWLLPAVGAVIVAALVIFGLVALFSSAASVKVPNVVGVDIGVARVGLQRAGLTASISEQRFSTKPRGTVLGQQPPPGTTLRRGESVALAISAGTEAFSLPDVTGEGIELAQGSLESRGLTVIVVPQPSTSASGTVLSSDPLPGVQVHTGDTVRLTVASTSTPAAQLSSFNMSAANIAIDPEPVSPGQLDVTMDVARRLQSLVQAAGGNAFVTRSVVETSLPADVRAKRVTDSTATALVVISADPGGKSGIAVFAPTYAAYALGASSHALSSQVASKLAGEGLTAPLSTIVPDTVLLASKGPATKVKLGSYTSTADLANFQDTGWADEVARGIYLGLGSSLGK